MKHLVAITVFAGMMISSGDAELLTFDLINKNGTSWDGLSAGVYTNAATGLSLEASLYAYLNGAYSAGSQLNSTAAEFGINASGSGDETALFDTNNGQEALWVSFDRMVRIKSITVASFTAGNVETGAWQVADGPMVNFTSSGTYDVDALLNPGAYFKVIAINEGGGNGWSLNSFTVEALPEPATALMLGFGGLTAAVIRRATRV